MKVLFYNSGFGFKYYAPGTPVSPYANSIVDADSVEEFKLKIKKMFNKDDIDFIDKTGDYNKSLAQYDRTKPRLELDYDTARLLLF